MDLEHGLSPVEQRMATEKVNMLVLKYSIPTIIGMLVNALYNVVDRFWVGKIPDIGTAALTGIGLCMPVVNVLMGFSQLIGIGAAANISIRLGRKDRDGAQRILGAAVALVVIVGAIVTLLCLIFAKPILTTIGADATILPYALSYYRIIVAGYIFFIASFGMNHPIRAMGNPKRFATTQLLGGISNMILDPIFIFVFKMGIEGAAIATIIAQCASAVWVLSYYFTGKSPVSVARKYIKLNKEIVLAIFSIGIAPFLLQVAGSVVGIVANRSLKYYGDLTISDGNIAISAMTVIMSVSTIFLMPLFGINQGTQPIVGFNYGAGNIPRVKETYKWSVIYSFSICVLGAFVIQLFAPQLVAAFNTDPELISVGSVGMRIFLLCIPFIGLQVPSVNFFQSIGRAKISIILSLLRQVIILIPAYIILPQFFGLLGIWAAGPIADTAACIITFFFIKKEFTLLSVQSS